LSGREMNRKASARPSLSVGSSGQRRAVCLEWERRAKERGLALLSSSLLVTPIQDRDAKHRRRGSLRTERYLVAFLSTSQILRRRLLLSLGIYPLKTKSDIALIVG